MVKHNLNKELMNLNKTSLMKLLKQNLKKT